MGDPLCTGCGDYHIHDFDEQKEINRITGMIRVKALNKKRRFM
jgi:hypothetical protein